MSEWTKDRIERWLSAIDATGAGMSMGAQECASLLKLALRTVEHPPAEALEWRVVANAGHNLSTRRKPRWAHVMDNTGFGKTMAIELCRRNGFDPDEVRR